MNGKIIEEKSFYLIPLNHHKYRYETEQFHVDEDRTYIVLSKDRITINTSWFGELPLFYYTKDDYFVVSSSFESLLFKLKEKHLDGLDFDRIAIFESMIFDNPLRARTLFKKISKILPGKESHSSRKIFCERCCRINMLFVNPDAHSRNWPITAAWALPFRSPF